MMQWSIKRRLIVWMTLVAPVIGMAACGVTPGGATPGAKGAVPASNATSGALSGQPPTNGVRVTLDKASYSPGATAIVTVANHLSASISTTDHKTNCTLVQLEQLVGGAWQAVAPCRSMIATRLIALAAGSATPQQISIPQGQPGSYRVAFLFDIGGAGSAGAQSSTVYSPTFTVG